MTGLGGDSQGVEVALAPEELELDPMAMTQKYEEHVREQQAQVEKEDFSDMVAEHAAKQKVPLHLLVRLHTPRNVCDAMWECIRALTTTLINNVMIMCLSYKSQYPL